LGKQGTDRHQAKPYDEAEEGKGLRSKAREHGKLDDRGKDQAQNGAHREEQGGAIGLIGARPEQQNDDRGEGDGSAATRPRRHDPEQRNAPDHDECAPAIDQGGQPIRHPDLYAATAPNRSCRIGDKQGQPVQRVSDATQRLCRLIGEELQRRRADREGRQSPHHCLAVLAQNNRVAHPAM
jgi:hypothetical protein